MRGLDIISADELVVELDGEYCIETVGQRAHRILMGEYLEGAVEGPEAEGALDTLARFLAQTDFRALRAKYPELAGGSRERVRIYRKESGQVLWQKVPVE